MVTSPTGAAIKDILQTKGARVVTIPEDGTVHDAIRTLNDHQIGALVVTDAGGDISGIVTERDILRACGDAPPEGRTTSCPTSWAS